MRSVVLGMPEEFRYVWRMVREDGFQVRLSWEFANTSQIDVETYDARESTAWNEYTYICVPIGLDASLQEEGAAAERAAMEWIALYGPLFV